MYHQGRRNSRLQQSSGQAGSFQSTSIGDTENPETHNPQMTQPWRPAPDYVASFGAALIQPSGASPNWSPGENMGDAFHFSGVHSTEAVVPASSFYETETFHPPQIPPASLYLTCLSNNNGYGLSSGYNISITPSVGSSIRTSPSFSSSNSSFEEVVLEPEIRAVPDQNQGRSKTHGRALYKHNVYCTHGCTEDGRLKTFGCKESLVRHEYEHRYRHLLKQYDCRFALNGSHSSPNCVLCNRMFSDGSVFKKHLRRDHKISSCEAKNSRTFVRPDDFRKHLEIKHMSHGDDKDWLRHNNHWKSLNKSADQPYGFGCRFCVKSLTTWDERIEHHIAHTLKNDVDFSRGCLHNEMLGLLSLPAYREHWLGYYPEVRMHLNWAETPGNRELIHDMELLSGGGKYLVDKALLAAVRTVEYR